MPHAARQWHWRRVLPGRLTSNFGKEMMTEPQDEHASVTPRLLSGLTRVSRVQQVHFLES